MANYIDKDKLIKELSVIQNRPVHTATKIIQELPTEEVQPIVHGSERMIKRTDGEVQAYVDGYNACYEKFVEILLGRNGVNTAIRKMEMLTVMRKNKEEWTESDL